VVTAYFDYVTRNLETEELADHSAVALSEWLTCLQVDTIRIKCELLLG